MLATTTQTNNRFVQFLTVVGSATAVVCWVILDYLGVFEVERMGSGAKDCYTSWINDEVQS